MDTENMREDMARKNKIMYLMNTLPEANLSSMTYDLMDILVDCSFEGRNCDYNRDFVRVMNPRLGACYTFNSGMNASKARVPQKTIATSGTDHALELTLFVDVKNYLPDVAPVAGYKLLIHDQQQPPIPDQEGFVLKPGTFTLLGLRASVIKRAVEPYGNCKKFSEADNRTMNMFLDSLPLTSPTMSTCMRTCEQSEIMYKCNCFSLEHGYSNAPAFEMHNATSRQDPCSLEEGTAEYNCSRHQLSQVKRKSSYCRTTLCKSHECSSRRFDVSQSIATWPTYNSFEGIQEHCQNIDNLMETYQQVVRDNSSNARTNFARNFLKVLVHFEDLNVITITTTPSYTWIDFLSDLGGQGGLWLGMSAFTILEVLVLIIEMVRLSMYYLFSRGKRGDRQEAQELAEVPLQSKEEDGEKA